MAKDWIPAGRRQLVPVLGLLLGVAYYCLPHREISYLLVGSLSGLAVLWASTRGVGRPWFWRWLGTGILLNSLADLVWNVYSWRGQVAPYPSAADAVYLLAYLCYVCAFIGVAAQAFHRQRVALVALLNALMVMAAAVFVIWFFIVDPQLDQGQTASWLAVATSLAYPVADLLLLGALVTMALSAREGGLAFAAVVVAAAAQFTVDTVYGVMMLHGAYHVGSWVDGGWILAYALYACAATHQSTERFPGRPARLDELASPYLLPLLGVALLLPQALMLYGRVTDHLDHLTTDVDLLFVAVADIGIPLLVLARLALLLQEHRRVVRNLDEERRLLAESEERYRQIVDNASEGMWTSDREGRVAFANPAMVRFLGYDSASEIVGRPLADFFDIGLVPAEERATSCPREVELCYRRRDGSDAWGHATVRPLYEDGQQTGNLAMVLDIDERRGLEEQLRQSQKMEAVGQLAGGVAHDFNNLLTAISGYAELALLRVSDDAELREDVEEITAAAARAAEVTRQLLAFSRQQVLRREVVYLRDTLRGMLRLLQRVIGEDVLIETAFSPKQVPVEVDPGQFEQVVVNLAVNARDAMPHGGRLRLTLEEAAAPGAPDQPGLLLKVVDDGCGMDEQTRLHAFDPFYTTKEVGKGTGLGLATVYGIVQQFGGQVAIASVLGVGTTISVWLPQAALAAPTPAVPTAPAPRAADGDARLLVVEDNDNVRRLTTALLHGQGYDVDACSDPTEALERLTRGRYDLLLLTDVVMPRMTGLELADRAVAVRAGLRVVYMSGYTSETLAGAHGELVRKPFTRESLQAAIERALAQGSTALPSSTGMAPSSTTR